MNGEIFKPGWIKEQSEKAKNDADEIPKWTKDAWKKEGVSLAVAEAEVL
jgi:hypothetical protein